MHSVNNVDKMPGLPSATASRETTMSKSLHQSLQEVLMDTSLDGLMGPGPVPQRESLINCSSLPPLDYGVPLTKPGSQPFMPDIVGVRSKVQDLGLMSSGLTKVSRSLAMSAAGATFPALTPPALSPSAALGLTSDELLLAAAAEKRMLDQAKVAAVRRAALIEQHNSGSLLGLLQRGLGGAPPLVANMTNAPQVKPSLMQTMQTKQMEKKVEKESKETLQFLGNSLRKKDSPYLDVSGLTDPDPKDTTVKQTRGGVTEPFPEKLHRMLEEVEKSGNADIVSFFEHGRAFGVHDPDRFVSEIMPKYFKQSRLSSFQRQLNLYGFTRINSGPDSGGYYHELFLKGRPALSLHMRRVGVPKGEDRRKLRAMNVRNAPNFYAMTNVSPTYSK